MSAIKNHFHDEICAQANQGDEYLEQPVGTYTIASGDGPDDLAKEVSI